MQELSQINPLGLPCLPLTEKQKLPNLTAIYFVISESDEVIYIGRTGNLASRWTTHHRYSQLNAMGNIRIAWFQCSDESLLPEIEEALIKHFQPCLNGKRKASKKPTEFSLGKRFHATRESLGLTQEQVIDRLKNLYRITLSQQALSYIENGKRKIDAERELPAFAGVYGKPIDYFYETLELLAAPPPASMPRARSVATVDLEALTKRDKLELAAELIRSVLQENLATRGNVELMQPKQPETEVKFTVFIPEIPLVHRLEAESKAKEAYVMTLLRHGDISSGRAARLLGIPRVEVLDLMGDYGISPFPDQTREELEREVAEAKLTLEKYKK